jgi:hypothetical protein
MSTFTEFPTFSAFANFYSRYAVHLSANRVAVGGRTAKRERDPLARAKWHFKATTWPVTT